MRRLDGLVTYRLWRELGFEPENTLHDLRWGQAYGDDYVWVLLISAPLPAHFIDGWKGASSERQPSMYFRLGGGTMKGISKPGHIVWSRVFVAGGKLHADIGTAKVVSSRRKKPTAAGRKPPPNGRSCMPSSMESPATR
ncbi:MAG: hypothetical protein U0903_16410 [Planctomycetales bacterium]